MDAILRFGYEPVRDFIETVGAMVLLFRRTLVAALTPPYNYGPELVDQFLFALRLGWFPMILASLAFTYGPAGIEVGNFLNLLGAIDRLGGIFVIIVLREFAPLVCAIVMAGVAGTAMTADLGARKIREELDALMVLGVDPIKSLVVPRFLSLMLLTPLFTIYALLFGVLGGVLVTLSDGAQVGPFFSTFFSQATTVELQASLVKSTIFGAMIAIVCCYKGLSASGGAEGVGRAVNQAVVLAFLAIGAIDYTFTQTLLATHPSLNTPR
ncbi:MAG TPA: ABC transporter permease [Solirubrobacteraceae bacterium]|jgi:phospholipid/cholesterol/gamma-HCH transport system permease protein|nr:ABC transporter permease [Solirubrobacteraceae bacterium]